MSLQGLGPSNYSSHRSFLSSFLVGLRFELRGALLLEPHLQSILLWLFWRWDLENYLPGLASNQITRIMGVSHWHLAGFLKIIFFICMSAIRIQLKF
jgi:hypothetical protein